MYEEGIKCPFCKEKDRICRNTIAVLHVPTFLFCVELEVWLENAHSAGKE